MHKDLSTLDTAKGSDLVDLHPFLLQLLAEILAEPITALYNKSLQGVEVPHHWRKAIICPIFKMVGQEGTAKYHPVILTSILCKIIEKLPKKALLLFFKYRIGFLPRRSFLSNPILQEERVTRLLGKGHTVDTQVTLTPSTISFY